eukprot:669655-Lingulodinium_polyedra.AAC.1
MGILVWALEKHKLPGGATALWLQGGPPQQQLGWMPVLSWEDYDVLPTVPLSPVHLQLLAGKGGCPFTGVALHQTGLAVPLLQQAALCGFWDLTVTVLRQLAKA